MSHSMPNTRRDKNRTCRTLQWALEFSFGGGQLWKKDKFLDLKKKKRSYGHPYALALSLNVCMPVSEMPK